jgi:hypothetical protein
LNSPKQIASRIVDLPEPFSPTINVLDLEFKITSIKLLPVESIFFH